MQLERLHVRNLRILQEARAELAPGVNVFFGANGSGKTSVLEAVHALGTARSFRSRTLREVITRGESELLIHGHLRGRDGEPLPVGVESGAQGVQIRVAGESVRTSSALARRVPVVAVTPESQRVLSDGAELRRRLMDWSLFHVEPGYHEVHQRFRRALRQRNHQLREAGGAVDLEPWNRQVGASGEALHRLRADCLDDVLPRFEAAIGRLLPFQVQIAYRAGWNTARPLAEALRSSAVADTARGWSEPGPHRADLSFTIEGRPARQVLSRGEGKLFVIGLLLAQAEHLQAATGRSALLLVDDLASELDEGSRGRLFQAIARLGNQVLVTTVDRALATPPEGPVRMFHVEQGRLQDMV